MKRFNQFLNEDADDITGKEPVQQNDDDLEFLNNLLGDAPKKAEGEIGKGERVTYYKEGSDQDGKSGTFVGLREDGKMSIRFDDGKRFAANPKNVVEFGKKKPEAPKKKLPEGYNEIPDDKLGRAAWGPGAFDLPDSFYGAKGAPEIKKQATANFKKGDKVIYTKDDRSGSFVEQREDGKLSIRFDDGTRMAVNPKNIIPKNAGKSVAKGGFILRVGNIPPKQDFMEESSIGVFVMLDNGKQYDREIGRQFPELARIELKEEDEGFLIYTGDLTKEELAEELKERDFRVEIIKGDLW